MSDTEKKRSRDHSLPLYILWFIISFTFTYIFLKPTVEGLVGDISGMKPPFISQWIAVPAELVTAAVLAFFGTIFTYLLEKRVLDELAKRYRLINSSLIKEIGTESSDSAYLAYHTIVTHTDEMKKLVNKLIKLPHHPQILRVLIDDYSKKANQSKFLVDFITFLKLGGILVENSVEMRFLNITPPYEWWEPLHFERNEEIFGAIENYKEKISAQMQKGATVRRITIVDEKDALTSVLEHGYNNFFNKRMAIRSSSDDIPETFTKVFMSWMENIISRYDQLLDSTATEDAKKILLFCKSHDFKSFYNEYYQNDGLTQNFKTLSHKISDIVIDRFKKLHAPIGRNDAALFICKGNLLHNSKSIIYKHAKEEGIFKDSEGNLYRLCMEETNGIGILLATIETINDINDTYFNLLKTKVLDDEDEKRKKTVGSIYDLVKQ